MITTIALVATGVIVLALGLPFAIAGSLALAFVATLAAAATALSLILLDDDRWSRALAPLAGLAFAAQVILAGLVAFTLPNPTWSLIAAAAATAAWDLGHFQRRLNVVPAPVRKEKGRAVPPGLHSVASDDPAANRGDLTSGEARGERHFPEGEIGLHSTTSTAAASEPHPRAATVDALTLAHLQRLGLSLATGLALGGLSLVVRLSFDLRTLALLTGLALIGLAVAVGFIRRRSD